MIYIVVVCTWIGLFLSRAIRKLKEIKGIVIGKKGAKILLTVDDMLFYISDSKILPVYFYSWLTPSTKLPDTKLNKKSVALEYKNDKWNEKEIGKWYPL